MSRRHAPGALPGHCGAAHNQAYRGDLPGRDSVSAAERGAPGDLSRAMADLVAAATRAARYAWFEDKPQLAVLATHFSGRADWLRPGQALERTWLTATVRGLEVSPLTHPLETADAWLVRDPRSSVEYPQMILRFGYGLPVPRTPRRPIPDILDTPT